MNQELELELTFLAKELPKEISKLEPTRIIDVYIPDTPEQSHLRLRQKGEKYEITKKTPLSEGDASKQIEQTIPLTKEEFTTLVGCSKKRVAKDRYDININGKPGEVDVFVEDLAGLVLIDFEFDTVEEKANFRMPDIALADVTQEDFIAGDLLAGKKYDEIASKLNNFNYKRINPGQ